MSAMYWFMLMHDTKTRHSSRRHCLSFHYFSLVFTILHIIYVTYFPPIIEDMIYQIIVGSPLKHYFNYSDYIK